MQPLSDLGGILDTASNSSDDRTLLTRLRRRSSSSFCLYCQLRASDPLVVDSLYQKVRMRNLEGPERRNLWNCSGSPVRPLAVSMRANCKRRKELMQNLTRRSSPRNGANDPDSSTFKNQTKINDVYGASPSGGTRCKPRSQR